MHQADVGNVFKVHHEMGREPCRIAYVQYDGVDGCCSKCGVNGRGFVLQYGAVGGTGEIRDRGQTTKEGKRNSGRE